MDYARKIGKSDEPKKWVKQFTTTVTARDGLIAPSPVFHEDRRLVNWKKWLERRKVQYRQIKSTTGRQQTDQVLNACEKVRPQIEMRNLLDYAVVPVPVTPDKYRGGPEFWRAPKILPKRGASCLPDITFTPNKKDLNITPELTYVDLPELIEKEKDLAGLKSKEPLWKRSQYLMRRRKELSEEIQRLVPKEPETKHLVIKNYVPPQKEVLRRVPPITISSIREEEGSCCACYPEQTIVLKIQDREIVWQRPTSKDDRVESDPIVWSLSFSGKVNRRSEKEIVFENKGNRVIVYQWRDVAFQSSTIPLGRRTSPFFFNKTKGVILPGQIVKLKIWYRPRKAYVFTEFWRLITSPVLCSSPLMFQFWGCAETPDDRAVKFNPGQLVDQYLDRCIRNTVIREIIEDIIDGVRPVKQPEPAYGSLFLESELFVAKNPLCFYSPSILIEFHKMYYNATSQKEHRWDMSLDDLREAILRIEQPERREAISLEFIKLYKESLKRSLYSPVQFDKNELVYRLLCTFFNLFEIESETAREACFAKEYKVTSGTTSEMSYEMMSGSQVSQVSVKSNNLRSKRGKRSSIRSQSSQAQVARNSVVIADDRPYKEVFFIRIHELLGKTLVRIFATIESYNNLNERDK